MQPTRKNKSRKPRAKQLVEAASFNEALRLLQESCRALSDEDGELFDKIAAFCAKHGVRCLP